MVIYAAEVVVYYLPVVPVRGFYTTKTYTYFRAKHKAAGLKVGIVYGTYTANTAGGPAEPGRYFGANNCLPILYSYLRTGCNANGASAMVRPLYMNASQP